MKLGNWYVFLWFWVLLSGSIFCGNLSLCFSLLDFVICELKFWFFFVLFSYAAATMVRVSVLNDALKGMYNAEKRGKRQVMIRPSSKVIIKFLTVMQKHGQYPKPCLNS